MNERIEEGGGGGGGVRRDEERKKIKKLREGEKDRNRVKNE